MKFKISFHSILIIIIIILLLFRFFTIEKDKNEILIEDSEIMNITISDFKGNKSIDFNDYQSIILLNNVLLNLKKENNIVNLSNPKYYLDILYKNEKKESYHLWIGDKYEKSFLINVNNHDIIYSISLELNEKLNELIVSNNY